MKDVSGMIQRERETQSDEGKKLNIRFTIIPTFLTIGARFWGNSIGARLQDQLISSDNFWSIQGPIHESSGTMFMHFQNFEEPRRVMLRREARPLRPAVATKRRVRPKGGNTLRHLRHTQARCN